MKQFLVLMTLAAVTFAETSPVAKDATPSNSKGPVVEAAGNPQAAADQAAKAGETGEAAAAKQKRDASKSTAIVTGAAAIGAVLGAATNKGDRAKGAMIGAAIGGAAGLIYDRMTKDKSSGFGFEDLFGLGKEKGAESKTGSKDSAAKPAETAKTDDQAAKDVVKKLIDAIQ